MASITIRNLDEDIKQRLRMRAAEHGRSMEEEARHILRLGVDAGAPPRDLAAAIRARIAPLGGVELDLPPREPMRAPPLPPRIAIKVPVKVPTRVATKIGVKVPARFAIKKRA